MLDKLPFDIDPRNAIDLQPIMELRESDPKTAIMTVGKALGNMKVIATIFCFFFGLYAVGWETIVVPSLGEIKRRDEAIQNERQQIEQREQQKRQFEMWENETASLTTKMVRLKPEQSAKVISLKESEKVVSLAKGSLNSKLPEPHNKREGVGLTALDSATLEIVNGKAADPTDAPPPPPVEDGAGGPGRGMPGSGFGAEGQNPTVSIEKFDYKVTLSGTYPAIVDFINQIVALDNLFAINEVTIERTNNDVTSFPDPEKFPDYPVKVTATVVFSIYLYVPTGVGAGG